MSAVLLQIVTQVSNEAMSPDHPEAGAAVTGPRVSESASSDGGCAPEAGDSSVGEVVAGEMVPAGLGDRSAEGEEEPTQSADECTKVKTPWWRTNLSPA